MRLLVIGSDRNLFSPDAPVRKRVIEQGDLVEELRIVVFSQRSAHFVDEQLGAKVFLHPTASLSRFLYIVDAFFIARQIIKKEKEWLISTQDPFESGIVGFILSRIMRVPLHVQLHTDPFNPQWRNSSILNFLRFLVGMFILRQASAVRVVSLRAMRGVMTLGVKKEAITVVPVFTEAKEDIRDVSDLHALYPGYERIILSVGRLEKEKDFSSLLFAFSHVRDAHPNSLLVIVGSGREHRKLVQTSERLGIDKDVRFLPWAHDVRGYFLSADCYVQPSRYEGWGMAVIEALSSGTPVVMTDVGCAGEVVVNGVSGLVVPVNSTSLLADAISRVLGDHMLRERLISGGKEAIATLPNKEQTYELYRKSWTDAVSYYNH